MVLITLLALVQWFITGANAMPPFPLFLLSILAMLLESAIEIKILSGGHR